MLLKTSLNFNAKGKRKIEKLERDSKRQRQTEGLRDREQELNKCKLDLLNLASQ